jgi:hypothetical protein
MAETASRRRLRTIDRLAADLHPRRATYAVENEDQSDRLFESRPGQSQIFDDSQKCGKRTIFLRIMCGAILLVAACSVFQSLAAINWVSTSGVITEVHHLTRSTIIHFRFQTASEAGTDTWHKGSEGQKLTTGVAEPGTTRTVFYDPNNPKSCLIHRPSVLAASLAFLFSLGVFIASVKVRKNGSHRLLTILMAIGSLLVLNCM